MSHDFKFTLKQLVRKKKNQIWSLLDRVSFLGLTPASIERFKFELITDLRLRHSKKRRVSIKVLKIYFLCVYGKEYEKLHHFNTYISIVLLCKS